MTEETALNPVELAAELTIAWLGNQNNRVAADDVPAFLRQMHATINELAGNGPADNESAGQDGSIGEALSNERGSASRELILRGRETKVESKTPFPVPPVQLFTRGDPAGGAHVRTLPAVAA